MRLVAESGVEGVPDDDDDDDDDTDVPVDGCTFGDNSGVPGRRYGERTVG